MVGSSHAFSGDTDNYGFGPRQAAATAALIFTAGVDEVVTSAGNLIHHGNSAQNLLGNGVLEWIAQHSVWAGIAWAGGELVLYALDKRYKKGTAATFSQAASELPKKRLEERQRDEDGDDEGVLARVPRRA